METYINKNILLDDIIQSNSFLLLFYSSVTENVLSYRLLDTVEKLRKNISISDDIILFNNLLINIDDIIVEKEAYKSCLMDYYELEIENINRILYLLENTKYKIRIFLEKLNTVDTITDVMSNMEI